MTVKTRPTVEICGGLSAAHGEHPSKVTLTDTMTHATSMVDAHFSTSSDTVIHVTLMAEHLPKRWRIYHAFFLLILAIEVRDRQCSRTGQQNSPLSHPITREILQDDFAHVTSRHL